MVQDGDPVLLLQALNFALEVEGAQQFPSGKGAKFCEGKVNLYWNFSKGTTAKAQGTVAIAAGAVGYFKACFLCIVIAVGIEINLNNT